MPKCTYRGVFITTDSVDNGPYACVTFQRQFEGEEKRRVESYFTRTLHQMERAKRIFNAVMDKALEDKAQLQA
jgi:hypothetical protein